MRAVHRGLLRQRRSFILSRRGRSLAATHFRATGARGGDRSRLCRLAAGRRVRPRRRARGRLRRRRGTRRRDRARRIVHRRRAGGRGTGRGRCRPALGDDRLRGPRRRRHHQHLRADTAAQDPRPRPVVRHRRGGAGGHASARRAARRAGVDHLSRHHRRGGAPQARGGGAAGRCRLLPRLLPGACRPRQHGVDDAEHPEGGRGSRCPVDGDRGRALPSHRRHRGAGLVAARRRDGQAAREHLPGRQHRARQRGGADVPRPRRRCLGGHRGRQDEAVRFHAVLPGAPASAATVFRSTRTI